MELPATFPMENAKPASMTIVNHHPMESRIVKAVTTETGIDSAMTRRLLRLREQKSGTRTVSGNASYRFSVTRPTAS